MAGPRIWLAALVGFACMGGYALADELRARPGDDTTGRIQLGEASFYHPRFHGQRMANGERFDAGSDSAASRTLPLGTVARVTNLDNGETARVRIEDRGPRSRRRILDVSPRTARQLGMRQSGTARVRVTPLAVPQRDGTIRRHAPRPAPARARTRR